MNLNCLRCGRMLCMDEIGLHKKMIDRGADTFMCLSCLAAYFSVSEVLLREKAEHFRKDGCTLFGKVSDLPPEENG